MLFFKRFYLLMVDIMYQWNLVWADCMNHEVVYPFLLQILSRNETGPTPLHNWLRNSSKDHIFLEELESNFPWTCTKALLRDIPFFETDTYIPLSDLRLEIRTCSSDYNAIIQLLGAFNSPLRESLSTSVDNNFTENFIINIKQKSKTEPIKLLWIKCHCQHFVMMNNNNKIII